MCRVIVWCAVNVFVSTLMGSTLLAAERYSIGEAVSGDPSKTPLIILKDGEAKVEAAIAPDKGGELSGLKVEHRGKWIETIYLARNYAARQGWTGKAPLLWPATGRNFPPDLEARQKSGERFSTGAYLLDGKRYEMPIHGFARDLPWRVEKKAALGRRAVFANSIGSVVRIPCNIEHRRIELTARSDDQAGTAGSRSSVARNGSSP